MTLKLLNIDDRHKVLVSLYFDNTTKQYKIFTELTGDKQISTLITWIFSVVIHVSTLQKSPPAVTKS